MFTIREVEEHFSSELKDLASKIKICNTKSNFLKNHERNITVLHILAIIYGKEYSNTYMMQLVATLSHCSNMKFELNIQSKVITVGDHKKRHLMQHLLLITM